MRVAFLGLGIMGSRMAANLARKGFQLTVWNRTGARAEEFAAAHPGVQVAATPAAAAAAAELVLTMVVDGPQVRELLLAEPDGAARGAPPGTVFVDCSTIGIEHAQAIGSELRSLSFELLDAPVTGSSPAAEAGTLLLMVGGARDQLERVRPALAAIGETIVYAGPLGQGQAVKLINNAVAATNAAVLAQALLLGAQLGSDLDALVAVLAGGSGSSKMVELKAEPMRQHDYTTLFKLDHMLKDLRLCLEAAGEAGASFPFAAETEQILAAAAALGHSERDFSALLEAVESAAGARL